MINSHRGKMNPWKSQGLFNSTIRIVSGMNLAGLVQEEIVCLIAGGVDSAE